MMVGFLAEEVTGHSWLWPVGKECVLSVEAVKTEALQLGLTLWVEEHV